MRPLQILLILISTFLSCRTKTDTTAVPSGFQLLIPDTTNNALAHLDLNDINHRSKMESQMGLSDLKKGADSLEIRLWYDFSFADSKELYVLKFQDTSCLLSYHRVYLRGINFDDENRNRNWNPFTDPIVDSSVSKSVLLTKGKYKYLQIDSIWFWKSQSELNISDSVGFTDCDSYIIEIADKKRFKYLRHHCPVGYYDKTKLTEILKYIVFCERITYLARKYNAVVPYHYD